MGRQGLLGTLAVWLALAGVTWAQGQAASIPGGNLGARSSVPLNQITAPTGPVSFAGQSLTLLAPNVNPGDALSQGLSSLNDMGPAEGDYFMSLFHLKDLGCPVALGDAASEGCALGAQTPAPGTFTLVTGGGLTPGIAGGGALATGSNSFAGTVTASAATGNVITPGFTCANKVILAVSDETTAGGAKVTASTTTTATYSATASDTVDYIASCR
jgi:hypothetical protein